MSSGKISLCVTGSEVVNGFIQDTNTRFFAAELYAMGYEVRESRVLRDDPDAILEAWQSMHNRGDVIINAGGLGPTNDDLTVDLLCQWLNCKAIVVPEAERRIKALFQHRARQGGTMKYSLDVALRQARIPEKSIPLENSGGLAPGIYVPEKNLLALPGFPSEIKAIWPQVPELLKNYRLNQYATAEIPVWAYGESALFAEIHPPPEIEIGVHALPLGCRLFLRSSVNNRDQVTAYAEELRQRYAALGEPKPLEAFAHWAIANHKKIAFAESCTGGLLAKQFTDIPGISACFQGAIVSYANEIKTRELDVAEDILAIHGAVSRHCAVAMAEGALKKMNADITVSLTGIAGPSGGSDEKPVGTLFMAIADRNEPTLVARFLYNFGRERFREAAAASAALALFQRYVFAPAHGQKMSDLPFGRQFMPLTEHS